MTERNVDQGKRKVINGLKRRAEIKFWLFLLLSALLLGLGARPDTWFDSSAKKREAATTGREVSRLTNEIRIHTSAELDCAESPGVTDKPPGGHPPQRANRRCIQSVPVVPKAQSVPTTTASQLPNNALQVVGPSASAALPTINEVERSTVESVGWFKAVEQAWRPIVGPVDSLLTWLLRLLCLIFSIASFRAFTHHRAKQRVAARVLRAISGSKSQSKSFTEEAAWAKDLLPSQRDFVDKYYSEFSNRDQKVLSTKIYAIRGIWGTGKSTILKAMKARLEEDAIDQALPVFLNAWREESIDDLHFRLVAHLALDPGVFSVCSGRLSSRFVKRMAQIDESRRSFNISELLTRFRAKRHIGETETESELELRFNLPTKLDFQDDLEAIVNAANAQNKTIVLFVDEIERGTTTAAQAMVVLLRRSFDLEGLQVVLPFVPDVMDAAVFNPLNQQSPELIAATEAVLSSHGNLKQLAQLAMQPTISVSLDSRRAFRQAYRQARSVSAQSADANTANFEKIPFGKGPTWHQAFAGHLTQLYTNLAIHEQKQVMAKIREKYFGFARDLPAPTAEDFVSLIFHKNQFLGSAQIQDRLRDVLIGAGRPLDQVTQEVNSFLTKRTRDGKPTGEQIVMIDELTGLLAPTKPVGSLLPLKAGAFSLRTFEGLLVQELDLFGKRPAVAKEMGRMFYSPASTYTATQILSKVLSIMILNLIAKTEWYLGESA
jgi:KAP family P-loop domain